MWIGYKCHKSVISGVKGTRLWYKKFTESYYVNLFAKTQQPMAVSTSFNIAKGGESVLNDQKTMFGFLLILLFIYLNNFYIFCIFLQWLLKKWNRR